MTRQFQVAIGEDNSARLRGRGPVEARATARIVDTPQERKRNEFPRPRGRGPVEASRKKRIFVFGSIFELFRARAGAAPLKPECATQRKVAECVSIAFRGPRGRGPVGRSTKTDPVVTSFRARAGAAPLKFKCA